MAYIQRNSYFRPLDAGETFQGQPTKIDDLELQTIRVSVQTDVSGVLTIFQSIDGQTWLEFNDTFTITGNSHKQVDVKGLYFYVEYENGSSATGEFNLYTTLSKTLSSAIVGLQEVLVVNESLPVTGLTFDASSNLLVKMDVAQSQRVNELLLNGDTLNSDVGSPLFDVSGYKKSVLSYMDAQPTSTASLALYGSIDGTNIYYIGEILPILNAHSGMRYASVPLDLSPFSHIQIINQSVDTIGGIVCFLFGIN